MQPDGKKTKVVLTVDTEPSVAGAFDDPSRHTPLLHEPVWGAIEGESQALGFLIRTLSQHGLIATFFVETVHTAYFSDAPMGHYVEKLMDANQDAQLHLHPCWRSFEQGDFRPENKVTDHCSAIDRDALAALIAQGAAQLRTWTGQTTTGMRTGNFSTSLSVFEAMADAGLSNASNICLAAQVPPEPELALPCGAHVVAGIKELPATCFKDVGPVGRGRLRPMQITALSAAEQIALLRGIHSSGGEVAVIVTHPFEFLKSDNYRYENMRPNRMVQKRFEVLCAFLAENREAFEVVSLEDAAAALTPQTAAEPLRGNAIRAARRAAENYLNDHLF